MSAKVTAKAGECSFEDFVFVCPDLDTYEDYQERVSSTKRRGPAYRELAQKCLKDPARLADLQAVFKRKPALPLAIANTLCELAGIEAEIVVGKD